MSSEKLPNCSHCKKPLRPTSNTDNHTHRCACKCKYFYLHKECIGDFAERFVTVEILPTCPLCKRRVREFDPKKHSITLKMRIWRVFYERLSKKMIEEMDEEDWCGNKWAEYHTDDKGHDCIRVPGVGLPCPTHGACLIKFGAYRKRFLGGAADSYPIFKKLIKRRQKEDFTEVVDRAPESSSEEEEETAVVEAVHSE
jgi:hypothetical protein